MSNSAIKPLGIKAYGSIPHLPGSRRGPGDRGLSDEQAAICTTKARDKHDEIIVQEKLDGSCVAVAKLNGEIVPLIRAGYRATDSKWPMHHWFHDWAMENRKRFDGFLLEGERIVGEWLAQAHGTRYELEHEPFVAFDWFTADRKRVVWREFNIRCCHYVFINPWNIHKGGPLSIEDALNLITVSQHGAVDPVEGAVWRVERNGEVDFLGKYVRQEKVDGLYLPEKNLGNAHWNWTPNSK